MPALGIPRSKSKCRFIDSSRRASTRSRMTEIRWGSCFPTLFAKSGKRMGHGGDGYNKDRGRSCAKASCAGRETGDTISAGICWPQLSHEKHV